MLKVLILILKYLPMQKLLISFFVLFCLIIPSYSHAQLDSNDIKLIINEDFHDDSFEKRKIHYLFADFSNPLVKYNPLSLLFGSLMFTYQSVVSPQFSASCLFHPSCSNFSIQLIREFGLIKGIALSADRVSRCSRIAATDMNPLKIDDKSGKVVEHTDMFKWNPK